jgi:hypothetical protein
MPYTARISRNNPSSLIFLIDQSASMCEAWGEDATLKKADKVADIINRFLQALSIKCAREDGVRDYYHIACIGYGDKVGPAFSGALAGREMLRISEIANNPARIEQRSRKVEDGTGGLVETTVRFPVWFDAVASGGTPMCQALDFARSLLSSWLSEHAACFPPIVVNVSDGESTDGDPALAAQSLRNLFCNDGNVLLFNAHISAKKGQVSLFRSSENGLVDTYAQALFQISDKLTDPMLSAASASSISVSADARGFVFNAQMEHLIQFVEIGTGTGAATSLR